MFERFKGAFKSTAAEAVRAVPDAERKLKADKLDPNHERDTLKWYELKSTANWLAHIFEYEDHALVEQALLKRTEFWRKQWEGDLLIPVNSIDEVLVSHGLRRNYAQGGVIVFTWSAGVVVITKDEKIRNRYCVQVSTSNRLASATLIKAVEGWISVSPPPPAPPSIYGLTYSGGGYYIQRVGDVSGGFERENYESAVIKDVDAVIKEFALPTPSARLALIDGKTGTGKTHIIAGIIAALPKARCVLIPAHLAESLAGPEFLQCLIHNNRDDSPFVLIFEDADKCLVSRENNPGGSDGLSVLLDLGDGLLGKALNLRVIATTNATATEIDPAVLRPGRLFRRIEVGTLSAEKAAKVYARLTRGGALNVFDKEYSLAEVYALARKK